ncbi:MAG: molybdenum cofactor guanylyltransferase [Myxococcota bacterium]|nr:molybdenum cofactor guanylyltransferase [Myxococcota bacterium]MEC8423180.1 molybdenum cofactor guanylyltransferase [Myxococcota bacterium]
MGRKGRRVIPGAVLAGGRSARMGRTKALVEFDGVPLAMLVARALLDAGCSPVVLVGNVAGLSQLGLPVVRDPDDLPRHPLTGVLAACSLGRQVLTAPCDLPGLTVEDVRALLAPGEPAEAFSRGRRQPLLGVVSAASAALLRDAIRAERSALDALVGRQRVRIADRACVNINTPSELAMLAIQEARRHEEP